MSTTARTHINALPRELLAQILLMSKPSLPSRRRGSHCNFERTITTICRHWREVALDSPRLWNIMYISRVVWLANLPLLRSWFRRTRSAPLEILIEIKDDELWDESTGCLDTDLVERAVAGFRLVAEHSWHWRHFECDFGSGALMCKHPFFAAMLTAGQAPMLETLALFFDDSLGSVGRNDAGGIQRDKLTPDAAAVYVRTMFDSVCPRLRDATLWGMVPYPDRQPHIFCGLQRMVLGLQCDEYPQPLPPVRGLLSGCPDLVTVELTYLGHPAPRRECWSTQATDQEFVRLDKLTCLVFGGFNAHEVCELLDMVYSPSVERLCITFEPETQDSLQATDSALRRMTHPHPAFRQVGASRFPSLKALRLGGLECSDDALRSVFSASSPTLERLALELTPAGTRGLCLLFDTHSVGKSKEILLPQLRVLRVFSPEGETFPVTLLVLSAVLERRVAVSEGRLLDAIVLPRETVDPADLGTIFPLARTVVLFDGDEDPA